MQHAKKVYDLNIAALAAKVNYNPNYVRWLAQKGKIPGKKIDGVWFFSWQDVAFFFLTQAALGGTDNGLKSKTGITDLLS